MAKITLLLVDDHQVMRKGLCFLLESQPDYEVVAEASSGEEAVELTVRLAPDLVLLDLSLPGMDGIATLQRIKEKQPEQAVLILTMHEDTRYLEKAMDAGANGFVLKRAADTELLSAVKAICRGEVYIDPGLQRYLISKALNRGPQKTDSGTAPLTPREIEVLRLVALGYSNQEIADSLVISVKTVDNHKSRIKEKLGLDSRAKLVRYAMEAGLV